MALYLLVLAAMSIDMWRGENGTIFHLFDTVILVVAAVWIATSGRKQ